MVDNNLKVEDINTNDISENESPVASENESPVATEDAVAGTVFVPEPENKNIKTQLTDEELELVEKNEKKKKKKRIIWNIVLTILAVLFIQFGINYNNACTLDKPFLLIPVNSTENTETYLGFGYTYVVDTETEVTVEGEVTNVVDCNVKLLGVFKLPHTRHLEEHEIIRN